jgi:hypothetical protein
MEPSSHCALEFRESHFINQNHNEMLPCGHFICDHCYTRLPNMVMSYRVYCRFCKTVFDLGYFISQRDIYAGMVKRSMIKTLQLSGIIQNDVILQAERVQDEIMSLFSR